MIPAEGRVYRVGNGENVSEGRPQDEARLAIMRPGKWGKPHTVLMCEVSWLDGHHFAAQLDDDVTAIQRGDKGSPEAGVAIFTRIPPTHPGGMLVVGSKATSEGDGGVRMRPLLGAEIDGEPVWAGHAPPPDSPTARARFLNLMAGIKGIIGLDSNRPLWWMRLRYPHRQVRGVGVLQILVPRRYKVSRAVPVDIDSDHMAFDVLIRPRRRWRRRR